MDNLNTSTADSAFAQGKIAGRQAIQQEQQAARLAELEAALTAERTAREEMEQRLADLEADRADDKPDDEDDANESRMLETPSVRDRNRTNETVAPPAYELDTRGYVKRLPGESRADYLARVRKMPPVGPERPSALNRAPRDIHEAHRHDGTQEQ